MFGNELIESITSDILGANSSIDFVVDKESSSMHFLFGDLLTLSDQRLKQRVLFSGMPNELVQIVVSRLRLNNPSKSRKTPVGVTIIIIDNSSCYLLSNGNSPDSIVNSPLKTSRADVVNSYISHFNHLWGNSDEVTIYEDLSDIIKTDNYSKIIVATEDVHDRLIYNLKQNPSLVHNLESYEFESLVETLLKRQGYDTLLTPRSKDGGKDIIARFKTPDGFNCLCLVECKKYSPERPVGVQWVRALYGVVEQQNANLGMLVTPSRFTKGAYDFQNEIVNKVSLKDFTDLNKWIKRTT